MDKFRDWWKKHRPGKRRLIQLYAALLYNANLKGFADGEIYQGVLKHACVPGLNCYSCPGAVGACPLGALQNALADSSARAPFYVVGILLLIGLTLGRVVCGFLCPVGLLQELLYKVPVPKARKSRVTRKLSYLKYIVLAVLAVGIPLWSALKELPVPAFCRTVCPAGTLEAGIGLLLHPANAAQRTLLGALFARKLILLIAILVAAMFIFRVFCRFICPLGAIYSLFSRIALLGVKVDGDRCDGCGRCVSACKMDVRRVGDHECIQCGACMAVCPRQAIRWKGVASRIGEKPDKRIRAAKILAVVLAVALLVGVLWGVNRPTARTEAAIGSEVTEVGVLCPDFTIPFYGGAGTFSPSEVRDRIAVLNFWATWCVSCLSELPDFEALAAKYPDDVSVIGIHAQLTTEDVQAFLDKAEYSIPMAYDADGAAIAAVGGSAILPVTVVLDREGRIICSTVGAMDFAELELLIKSAL